MVDLLPRVVIAELNKGIGISIIVGSTLYGITFAFCFCFHDIKGGKEGREESEN